MGALPLTTVHLFGFLANEAVDPGDRLLDVVVFLGVLNHPGGLFEARDLLPIGVFE